jgi:hypothetical protein
MTLARRERHQDAKRQVLQGQEIPRIASHAAL